ncbi:MAG TPA: hypothetical protein VK897_11465 [Anaerolineales bacterium]|nr:hypothetical protein [Anaerolineales bacterium]
MKSGTMKTLYQPALLFLPIFALFIFNPLHLIAAEQDSLSPTPTYNPLEEPPLPDNPTDLELGRNLYWHWCMTCHGDRGQGLTDAFRGTWEPDHQNCWDRGCHSGRPGEEGFPIPTIVPALVNDGHIARFASVEELADFLKTTHPPQSPGILKYDEYQAIALYVFSMNGRRLVSMPITSTAAPVPTSVLMPPQEDAFSLFYSGVILIFAVFMIGLFAFARRTHIHN